MIMLKKLNIFEVKRFPDIIWIQACLLCVITPAIKYLKIVIPANPGSRPGQAPESRCVLDAGSRPA